MVNYKFPGYMFYAIGLKGFLMGHDWIDRLFGIFFIIIASYYISQEIK
jgi:hypothetical protein